MQVLNAMNSLNAHASRINSDDSDPSPESILFSKMTSSHVNPAHSSAEANARTGPGHSQFDSHSSSAALAGMVDRSSLMYRDGLDTIKSEPEPILN